MPFLGCDYTNPMGAARPRPPDPRQQPGPQPAPAQGDHVFGNIANVIKNGLMAIIGGGQTWGGDVGHPGRFGSPVFDQNGTQNNLKTGGWVTALNQWAAIRDLDLGHTNPAQIVTRNPNIPEPDNHSFMFGGRAAIFRWDLCEIVCTDSNNAFTIGSQSPAQGADWVGKVISSYDNMMEVIVDQTALASHIAGLDSRVTNVNSLATHTAISRTTALGIINAPGGNAARKGAIRQICDNFITARGYLNRLLVNISNINIYWNKHNARWVSL